jgi:hypothetical protein
MAFYQNATASMTEVLTWWLEVYIREGGMLSMITGSYNASWAAAASTYSPHIDPVINNTAWRSSAYNFCRLSSNTTCSLLMFNSYGNGVFDKSLTSSLFLLNDGACSKQFLVSPDAFARMVATPPTPVVENYVQCTLTPTNSFMNAVGIASGNVSAMIPVVLFVLLPAVYIWLSITGNVKQKAEYEETETDATLKLLALQILRIRDNKLRGLRRRGQLYSIAGELIYAAKYADGTCVDSDDSGEDEGDFDVPAVRKSEHSRKSLASNVGAEVRAKQASTLNPSIEDTSSVDSKACARVSNRQSAVRRNSAYEKNAARFLQTQSTNNDSDDEVCEVSPVHATGEMNGVSRSTGARTSRPLTTPTAALEVDDGQPHRPARLHDVELANVRITEFYEL